MTYTTREPTPTHTTHTTRNTQEGFANVDASASYGATESLYGLTHTLYDEIALSSASELLADITGPGPGPLQAEVLRSGAHGPARLGSSEHGPL